MSNTRAGECIAARRRHLVPEIPTCKIRGVDGYQYHPLWINPADAAARGIEHGDVVGVYNERGTVLAGAYVTERMHAGSGGYGSWGQVRPHCAGGDRPEAAPSTPSPPQLHSKNTVGMAVSGFLAEVEKVDLEALQARYPEAFARQCHIAAGPCIAGITESNRGEEV